MEASHKRSSVSTLQQAAQRAVEVMDSHMMRADTDEFYEAKEALRQALAQREWVGLTLNEAEDFYEKYTDRAELINAIDKFLEEKNT